MNEISLKTLLDISLEAGREIMQVYEQDFTVRKKEDNSPLTEADNRSHQVIIGSLQKAYGDIPVLSEEGTEIPYEQRKKWDVFFLVDPLDGTKEFIRKNGEFTVNIALIENGYPVIGVIYAPVLDVFYFGCSNMGAFKLEKASKSASIHDKELVEKSTRLSVAAPGDVINIVASRSHMSKETGIFVEQLSLNHEVNLVSVGSSLKFCIVAEGKADYYPRYAPTMEWDTGAGQAIVEAAGGTVLRYEDHKRFYYNRENLRNGWFLVSGKMP